MSKSKWKMESIRGMANSIVGFLFMFLSYTASYGQSLSVQMSISNQYGCNDTFFLNAIRDAIKFHKDILPQDCKELILENHGDSIAVNFFYCNSIYFTGWLFRNSKIGVWAGFFKGRRFFEAAFLGNKEERPIYQYLWSRNGKKISTKYYSLL